MIMICSKKCGVNDKVNILLPLTKKVLRTHINKVCAFKARFKHFPSFFQTCIKILELNQLPIIIGCIKCTTELIRKQSCKITAVIQYICKEEKNNIYLGVACIYY